METLTFDELNRKMVELLEAFTSGNDHGDEAYRSLQAAQKSLCEAHGWAEEDYYQRLESEFLDSSFPTPKSIREVPMGTENYWEVECEDLVYEMECAFQAAREELGCDREVSILFPTLQGALAHASRVLEVYAQNSKPIVMVPTAVSAALKKELGLNLWADLGYEYRASAKPPVIVASPESKSCTLTREVEVRASTKRLLTVEVEGEVYTREGRAYSEWALAGEAYDNIYCQIRKISIVPNTGV